jgi:succinate dehydrogenase / fumarate reductase, iron-sulfur subunit
MEMDFRIFRFDAAVEKEPRYQEYRVSAEPEERILDCLNRIKWEHDGTLSYRMSCGHGVCGSDGMRINGVCALACQKLVREYAGTAVTLEPLPFFKVLKDLTVDMDAFLEGIVYFRPWLITVSDPPERERPQSPEEAKRVEEAIRCILCACCTGACPVMEENPRYVGPAALVWAFRYVFDSRDEEKPERLKQLDVPDGVWSCANYFECTRVCPKKIPVTKCINILKSEIERTLR